jgi:cation:H+ antiporter
MLILGIILVIYTSEIAVKHSAILASALGVSNLVIGISLVAIGTDISEIFNSLISCYMGHGDINVGDSVGSDLAQLTLVFGLLPFICGAFKIAKKEFLIIGGCEVLSLILIFTVVEKGYFTRLDAIFMIGSFVVYLMVIYNVTKSDSLERVDMIKLTEKFRSKKYHATIAALAFIGVAIGAWIIIQSVIVLSMALNVHEYIISFFIVALGTSLPELAVCVNALKKKQYDLAIGNVIGSCIVDSTISIAIGYLFWPQKVTASLAIPTILYTICVSIVVIVVVSVRGKMDKKAGVLFIAMYFGSYILLFTVLL